MNEDEQLDRLAFCFFKLFARYENALKAGGFMSRRNDGSIRLKWGDFVDQRLEGNSLESLTGEVRGAAQYIFKYPPKRQILKENGQLDWDPVIKDESLKSLFFHLGTVRNNLFHGAKFEIVWFDKVRNKELLEAGLVLLEYYAQRIFGYQAEPLATESPTP